MITTDDQVNAIIERWNEDPAGPPLLYLLGWSINEYAAWVMHGTIPENVSEA